MSAFVVFGIVTVSPHALHLAAKADFHVAVVDYRLYGSSMDGLQLITRLHDANPFTRRAIINALNALAF
jgi:CheY-like chemotaxis protein